MNRAGFQEDYDGDNGEQWAHIRWRGQVLSSIRGKRGQAFLKELVEALDAMPTKRLIKDEFWNGESCAIGVLGNKRGIDPITIDPEDYDRLADFFGVSHQLIREIEFENDEVCWQATPEERWQHMRRWVEVHIVPEQT